MRKSFFKQINSDLKNHGGNSISKKFMIFFFNYNFGLLFSYRLIKRFHNSPLSFINLFLVVWQNIKYGSYISREATLGENVKFPHAHGIIIGASKIEQNVRIYQQVTIGSHGVKGKKMSWPTIKEGAIIYAGAKIIGNITIGKNCVIGANCVVSRDLPDEAILANQGPKIVGYNSN